MKAFVIVVLSIWVITSWVNVYTAYQQDDIGAFIISLILLILSILALIFVSVSKFI